MRKTVLSLCDKTGNMVRPWLDAGYDAITVDIQHPSKGTLVERTVAGGEWITWGADVLEFIPPPRREYVAVFCFPPCTDLAVSGARWFKEKGLPSLIHALTLVNRCREIAEFIGAPWFIENPVSTISTYWRKPDYTFNPCDYGGYLDPIGDRYTKKTCLWTGAGFRMPLPKPVEPTEGSKMHLLPPSEDRGDLRSATPMGFAQAVFEEMSRDHL